MKINSSLNLQIASGAALQAKGPAAKPANGSAPAASASATTTLGRSEETSAKPPVNSARIAEIKQAIAEGRFKINPEAIADGLIDTARDLIRTQRRA